MKKLTLSAMVLGALSTLAASSAQAQGYVDVAPQGYVAQAQPNLVPASFQDTVASYVVDGNNNITGLALSSGVVVLTANTRVPLGMPVRVDGFIDPNDPQTVYQATVYNNAGAVMVQPSTSYVVGGYYPAYRGYAPRYYAPRTWAAPVVAPRPVYQGGYYNAGYRGGWGGGYQPAYQPAYHPAYQGGYRGGWGGGYHGGWGGGWHGGRH